MDLNGRPNILACLDCLLCVEKIRQYLWRVNKLKMYFAIAVAGKQIKNVSVCNVDATISFNAWWMMMLEFIDLHTCWWWQVLLLGPICNVRRRPTRVSTWIKRKGIPYSDFNPLIIAHANNIWPQLWDTKNQHLRNFSPSSSSSSSIHHHEAMSLLSINSFYCSSLHTYLSILRLNTSIDSASMTCFGRWFQWLYPLADRRNFFDTVTLI